MFHKKLCIKSMETELSGMRFYSEWIVCVIVFTEDKSGLLDTVTLG